ncbi:MAG: hypothetical protein WC544_00560 [Patescibacteria group bacterium]
MKKNTLLILTVIALSAIWAGSVLLFPVSLQAQSTNTGNTNTGATTTTGTPSLPNPLGKNVDLIKIMLRVLQILLAAVDIFALFMVILGGFEFLISAGNPNMVKKAKDTLVWAIVGILVITLSYSVLKFIFEEIQKKL